ncbi:amidase signature domain-containing protein [Aspergillus karnatakaensis]|uniref:amidase signature domain-containing protein n=1 Tax=Aspergillus karnatakaensis TaxID=1810916 RepID=UPI003CCD9C1F
MTIEQSAHELETPVATPLWEQRAAERRAVRNQKVAEWQPAPMPVLRPDQTNVRAVPRYSGLLTTEQIMITDSSVSQLLRQLATGTWTAESVVRAFISRTTIAHHLTNPLTDVFFDRAVEQAQRLDVILRETGKPVGPLHGLPVSLKDVMHTRGGESTLGFIARIGCKSETEDRLVTKLQEAGAVFYCKTNVPQTLMSGECVNYIYGRTSTPFNTLLSAGGSSGGEGSLVSLGGSPLGIGSDIAGSIRTPANFNGIYGLCPSPDRLPGHSAENSDGSNTIRVAVGPLSRSVDGLEVYTRTLLSLSPWDWDFGAVAIPWREDEYALGRGQKRPLCFGFMAHDSVVLPNPPIMRGMQELRSALVRAGHQVIDIEPFDGKELAEAAFHVFFASGGEEVTKALAILDEPLIKEVTLPEPATKISVLEYHAWAVKVNQLRQKYLDIWLATIAQTKTGFPVDAIILPSGGTVAPPHGTMEYFTYEMISNVLEWTCATVPVTTVDPVLDAKPTTFEPMSEHDQRNYDKYTPDYYKDGPVCLQVMGRRHEEEKVLGLLRTIDGALGRGEHYMA